MNHLDDIPDALWEWGRLLLTNNIAAYQQEQPRFANDPALGHLFRAVDVEMLVNAACEDLLTVLGLSQLVLRHGWRLKLSAPFDMNDWLEGRMTANLNSQVVQSPLILPQGQQRLYLHVVVNATRRER